jgi:hypothetical protein
VGEAARDEGAQIDRGGSGARPGVVLGDAEVAQLDRRPCWLAVKAMIRSTLERVG